SATPYLSTLSLHDAPPILGAERNDADHRGTDAVEHRLHPREPAVGDIRNAERHYHDEGRQHERDAGERRARDAVMHVAEVDRERSEEHTSELQSPDHLVCR